MQLRGVFCSTGSEAHAGAGAGPGLLVLRNELANGELAALCATVPVPVFARGLALDDAWALGASGLNEIGE